MLLTQMSLETKNQISKRSGHTWPPDAEHKTERQKYPTQYARAYTQEQQQVTYGYTARNINIDVIETHVHAETSSLHQEKQRE